MKKNQNKKLCATWTLRESRENPTDFTCDYIRKPQMSKDYLKSRKRKRRRSRRRKERKKKIVCESWKAIAHWKHKNYSIIIGFLLQRNGGQCFEIMMNNVYVCMNRKLLVAFTAAAANAAATLLFITAWTDLGCGRPNIISLAVHIGQIYMCLCGARCVCVFLSFVFLNCKHQMNKCAFDVSSSSSSRSQ